MIHHPTHPKPNVHAMSTSSTMSSPARVHIEATGRRRSSGGGGGRSVGGSDAPSDGASGGASG
jgi:hypothetical protein